MMLEDLPTEGVGLKEAGCDVPDSVMGEVVQGPPEAVHPREQVEDENASTCGETGDCCR